jgi:hypothetical protein
VATGIGLQAHWKRPNFTLITRFGKKRTIIIDFEVEGLYYPASLTSEYVEINDIV